MKREPMLAREGLEQAIFLSTPIASQDLMAKTGISRTLKRGPRVVLLNSFAKSWRWFQP